MIRLLLVALLTSISLGCAGCGTREIRVKDVTKNETIVLQNRPGASAPFGLRITGQGTIAGNAEVQLILNGAVRKKAALSGPVRFVWDDDWYSQEAEVRYRGGTATSGEVTLRYDFR